MSRASSSNERPSVPPAPAVSSRCSGHVSDSSKRLRDHGGCAVERRVDVAALLERRAGVEHDRVRAEQRARTQRAHQRDQRLLAQLGVLRGAVEEVDGVDQQRVHVGVPDRFVIRRDLLLGVLARLPLARVLVEDLDHAGAQAGAALDGHRGAAARGRRGRRSAFCAAVLACCPDAPGPLRALAHGRAPHRRRAHRAVQLAARTRAGRGDGAADRGHGPRALHGGERPPDLRGARVARHRPRRRAGLPVAAGRAPRRGRRGSCSTPGRPTARPPARTRSAPSRRPTATAASAARTRGRARSACASPTRA